MTTITLMVFLLINYTFAGEHEPTDAPITKLDLSNKGLTSLKEYDFSKYPLLEEIDLSNNELEHIKEETFQKNTKLVKINLSGNKKLQFPKYQTLLITNIEEIDLSNCNIKKLSQNIFDGLRYLKTIDLSNNPIKKKGLNVRALYTIEPLQKIILPHVSDYLLKELCKDFNITIEIKNEKETTTVQCKDYVMGKNEEEDDYDDDDEDVEKDGKTKTVEVPAVGSLSISTNNKQEDAVKDVPDDLNVQSKTSDDSKALENPPEVPNEKPHLEPRADGETSETDTNKTEHNIVGNISIVEGSVNMEIMPEVISEKPHLEPRASNETVTDTKTSAVGNSIQTNVSTDTNSNKESPNLRLQKPVNENKNASLNETENIPVDSKKVSENNMERMETNPNDKETENVAKVTASSNTGSTILIVLVIAVVIAGIAAFGYKFYKNRTNQGPELIERELKEIVATKPLAENSVRDITEQEPLMNNHTNKENGDSKQNHSQIVSNNLSTGPYQPTTITFKPIDQMNENNK